ncbi:MAG: hypothetical protein ACRC1Z_20330 [Waterburya sp.]
MKKLIYISAAALTLAIQGITFAATSTLDDVDFKQLVCSSMKGSPNKVEALTEVYSMTQTVLSSTQKQTLMQLAKNKKDARAFCKGIKV